MFGRKPSQSKSYPAVSPEMRECLERLEQLGAKQPALQELVALYRELVPLLFERTRPINLTAISLEHVAGKLANGVPLLRGESLDLGEPVPSECWQELCTVVSRLRRSQSPLRLAQAVVDRTIVPGVALLQIIEAGPGGLRNQWESLGLDVPLALSLLRLWALPLLEPLARALESNWHGHVWGRGYCPVCGSWPLLAELRGLEQFRHLRCGLCAASWQVDHVLCPLCETRDHRQLGILVADGAEQYRVTTCDACRIYLRSISTLTRLTAPRLLVAELETVQLALVAEQRGYKSASDTV